MERSNRFCLNPKHLNCTSYKLMNKSPSELVKLQVRTSGFQNPGLSLFSCKERKKWLTSKDFGLQIRIFSHPLFDFSVYFLRSKTIAVSVNSISTMAQGSVHHTSWVSCDPMAKSYFSTPIRLSSVKKWPNNIWATENLPSRCANICLGVYPKPFFLFHVSHVVLSDTAFHSCWYSSR